MTSIILADCAEIVNARDTALRERKISTPKDTKFAQRKIRSEFGFFRFFPQAFLP
jgi:hypothetical protein